MKYDDDDDDDDDDRSFSADLTCLSSLPQELYRLQLHVPRTELQSCSYPSRLRQRPPWSLLTQFTLRAAHRLVGAFRLA